MTRRSAVVFTVALCVVGLGLMAMTVAGASRTLVVIQAVVGTVSLLMAAVGAALWRRSTTEVGARVIGLMALVLMASPLLFPGVDGVRRWIDLGPIQMQPAAIALPLVVWFAVHSSSKQLAALSLMIAAGISAVQPDPQMATGITAVALCMALLLRGGALWWSSLGVSVLAGVVAAFGPVLEPVPYVEEVLPLSFRTHWGLGLAVAAGLVAVSLLMLAASRNRPPIAFALAALWGGLVSACLTGQLPTPVLGYGLSWLLGFAISLGLAARKA